MKELSPDQKEAVEKLAVFFSESIEPKSFAIKVRRFVRAAVTYYLEDDTMLFQEDIKEGYAQLTEFLEQIDPVLEEPK